VVVKTVASCEEWKENSHSSVCLLPGVYSDSSSCYQTTRDSALLEPVSCHSIYNCPFLRDSFMVDHSILLK